MLQYTAYPKEHTVVANLLYILFHHSLLKNFFSRMYFMLFKNYVVELKINTNLCISHQNKCTDIFVYFFPFSSFLKSIGMNNIISKKY